MNSSFTQFGFVVRAVVCKAGTQADIYSAVWKMNISLCYGSGICSVNYIGAVKSSLLN